MTLGEYTRRQVLEMGVGSATGGLARSDLSAVGSLATPVEVRGAVYFPSRAWNTYQMWRDYDPDVIARDFGYANRLNLNAVRIQLSYEFWKERPDAHGDALDHLLETAAERGLDVLAGTFDFVGRRPTERNLNDTDPRTATAVHSPSQAIRTNPARWDEPRRFLRWVLDRYRDDNRLMGIEVMNEPGWSSWGVKFARAMFRTAAIHRGRVPLTIGSTSMANNTTYNDWGIDIMQLHYNFPQSRDKYRNLLRQVEALSAEVPEPIWLTEWQRIRPKAGEEPAGDTERWEPHYASLAPVIQESGVGNFFWSLMVKPAYLLVQRQQGVLTGVFHEDGSVWSADDARAIEGMSGTRSGSFEERREWPEWATAVKEAFLGP